MENKKEMIEGGRNPNKTRKTSIEENTREKKAKLRYEEVLERKQ